MAGSLSLVADGRSRAEPRRPGEPARFEARAPEAHRAMKDLDGALWLEPRLRELVEVRTSQLNGCASALVRHAREALELGESHHRLAALDRWRSKRLFSKREQAALGLAEALALLPSRAALDRARQRAADQFAARELDQLVFACAAANAWNRLELAADAVR